MKLRTIMVMMICMTTAGLHLSCEAAASGSPADAGVESVSIDSAEPVILDINSTFQLEWSILPVSAANKTVRFSSGNPAILSVTESGLISSTEYGRTFVTITTEDGNFSDTIAVRVSNPDVYQAQQNSIEGPLGNGFSLLLDKAGPGLNIDWDYPPENSGSGLKRVEIWWNDETAEYPVQGKLIVLDLSTTPPTVENAELENSECTSGHEWFLLFTGENCSWYEILSLSWTENTEEHVMMNQELQAILPVASE